MLNNEGGIRRIDLAGQKIGRLTVIDFSHSDKNNAHWICECDCGTRKIVSACTLRRKNRNNQGCGCVLRTKGGKTTKFHAEYHAWINLIARCTDPSNASFKDYGARGITVCERWLLSFDDFLADVGPRTTSKHTLDRNDNDKGYSPENCSWETRRSQSLNTRRNHYLTLGEETLTITEWSERLNIPLTTIRSRIRYGWDVERILKEPVRPIRN